MRFIVCKTENATSLKNIGSMQDTGVVTYNILLYFKVHLEGLSKQAQVQVLLQVNRRLLVVCRITTAPDINLATKLLF